MASSWRSRGSIGHRCMVWEARFTKMKALSCDNAMLIMGALSCTFTAICAAATARCLGEIESTRSCLAVIIRPCDLLGVCQFES